MSECFQKAEAIILRAVPFREDDHILTLFTSNAGIIKVIDKGSAKKQRKGLGGLIPLTKVEVVYVEKRGEIFHCHEIHLLDSFSGLRKDLCFLEVACELLHAISLTQFVGKNAAGLYQLLSLYLAKISSCVDPWTLATSFHLKLLKYEGLIFFPLLCEECQVQLEREAYIKGHEGWCSTHKLKGSELWNQSELEDCFLLSNCQNFSEIHSKIITQELKKKTTAFFEGCIKSL